MEECINIEPMSCMALFTANLTLMIVLTILLIGLIIAVWKCPACVKLFGRLSLITPIGWFLYGVINLCGALSVAPDVSMSLVAQGAQIGLYPVFYGMMIYVLSLIVRLFQAANKHCPVK